MTPLRKAGLPLDIIVVGAGVAGLACAYALGRSGHRVRVVEKDDELAKPCFGIRVPPNLYKLLLEWGLEEEMSSTKECRKLIFQSYYTGELVGHIEWQDDVIKETGGEFKVMDCNDLYQMLYRLVLSVDVKVIFGAEVVNIWTDESNTPHVLLKDGTDLQADMVVGADGNDSVVREVVTGFPDEGEESGLRIFSTIIPGEKLKADPELANLPMVSEWLMWMGDSRLAHGHPVHGGEDYAFIVWWPWKELVESDPTFNSGDGFDSPSTLPLENCDDRIRRIFNSADTVFRRKYTVRKNPEDWVDETGRIVLTGEAAHPQIPPCSIHNYSLAIEDAVVLGELFSRLQNESQIPQFLDAFQQIRQPRATLVCASEVANVQLMLLPEGEAKDMRDAGMKMSLQMGHTVEWTDDQLLEQWETLGEVFGYHAREEGEEWWLSWGMLGDNARALYTYEPLSWKFQVNELDTMEGEMVL